ncbi:MAG: hypothetical protein U9Q68_02785 [Euryarchaeota archaeon]|nr:hypothetical protein [Euryarchaeota archaeon]
MFKYDGCDVAITHISAEHDARCNMNTTKLIGTSMLALLIVAISVGMAAAVEPDIQACQQNGDLKQEFLDAEDVYVTGSGTGDDVVDVYVMKNKDTWTKSDTVLLNSYSEYVFKITATIQSDGTGFTGTDAPAQKLWGGDSTVPGTYDIIMDVGQDGYFNGNDDCQNGLDIGFHVVPEFATIAIPMIALLGLVLYMRRKKD